MDVGTWVIALGVREMWTDLRFFVEVYIYCRWSRSGEIKVKEVKHNSQGFGWISLVIMMPFIKRRVEAKSFFVSVFSLRFLWDYQKERLSTCLDEQV